MDIKKILSYVDHTLLSQAATWEEIKAILDDGIKYSCASCCIPASFVKKAKEYVDGKVAICTVIGFPNGYSTTETKCFETADAVKNGADEIDMVINIGELKAGNNDYVLNEIKALKEACGDKILKVIIETCLLSEEEKVTMCRLVSEAGADFIKTSTGFGSAGAKVEDIVLMKKNISPDVRIKAAGGIRTVEAAKEMLDSGAIRIGASKLGN